MTMVLTELKIDMTFMTSVEKIWTYLFFHEVNVLKSNLSKFIFLEDNQYQNVKGIDFSEQINKLISELLINDLPMANYGKGEGGTFQAL